MYRALILATVFTIVSAPVVFAQEGEWTGNINGFLGAKALNNDDWSPAEDEGEIGIKFDIRHKSWPISLAIDYNYAQSGEENFSDPFLGNGTFQSTTTELNIGIRKIWEQLSNIRPFIGGGISFESAKGEVKALGQSASESDNGTGFWFGGGVYWTLAEHFNLGLDLEVSSANVTIAGVDVNSGGGHFGFLAGYHW